ncbi:hypothetical protein M413DRAFT_444437 [Hebeloma cylindrosporum]|uniref:Cytochrome P450 monooxygenase pc-3 n=1 Tax=Hebeloma cylindrosporum TaxID=76867 RepID=A0A0C3CGN9_HEBCY|nr:hypothetical protein M413DRAFT_444437 [Hebeloma cylindrosporum h7]
MPLPPGPVYLLQNLPNVVLLPSLVLVTVKVLPHFGFSPVPAWIAGLACFLSFPLSIFVQVQYRDIADRRAAASHGAVLPPRVYDKRPGGLTLLARMLDNLKNGYPGEMFFEWAEKYGNTMNFKVLFENRIFTTEPEYIKAILATQFDKYEKGPLFKEQMQAVLGTGVFNSDGEMWKFHRAMTRPFFSKDRISHFDIFDRHAADALGQLKARLREGYPVDIQDLASRFTMDSATEFLFNQDVRSLAAGLPYPHYSSLVNTVSHDHPANKFSRAFDEAQRLIALRSRRGVNWPMAEFWKDKVQEQMKIVNAFIEPIMRAAVTKKQAQRGDTKQQAVLEKDREVKDGESLLEHLINYTEDETVLRDEILNILLAGRDTTTNSITFAIYMLAENPHILKRLRQEILDTVGETRRPTFDDMKDMNPFNIRTTSKPVILPGKYGGPPLYIPAHTKSPYSVFMMHRRKDLWGPDANIFDPDRFLDERLRKYLTPNPFIFLPFNAAPRICLGQQLAYHETSFFLIRLLQQFSSISHIYDAQPPESRPPAEWMGAEGTKGRDKIRIKTYMTMSVMGGCWVKLEEANPAEALDGNASEVV